MAELPRVSTACFEKFTLNVLQNNRLTIESLCPNSEVVRMYFSLNVRNYRPRWKWLSTFGPKIFLERLLPGLQRTQLKPISFLRWERWRLVVQHVQNQQMQEIEVKLAWKERSYWLFFVCFWGLVEYSLVIIFKMQISAACSDVFASAVEQLIPTMRGVTQWWTLQLPSALRCLTALFWLSLNAVVCLLSSTIQELMHSFYRHD